MPTNSRKQRKNIFSRINFGGFITSGKARFNYFSGAEAILENRDSTIQRFDNEVAGNGADIYLDLFSDPFLVECFQRALEVLNEASIESVITKESDDPEVLQKQQDCQEWLTENLIETGRITELVEILFVSLVTGIAAGEVNYSPLQDGTIGIRPFTPVDPERIIYAVDPKTGFLTPKISTRLYPINGEEFGDEKLIIHTYRSVSIYNPYGLGMGSQLKVLIDFKNELLKLWIRIVEKFSAPIVVAKIPEIADIEEVEAFLQDLKFMSENARFVLPPDFELDVKDVSGTGADTLVQPYIDYIDRQISGLILGESITGKELANGSQARDIVASKITVRKAKTFAAQVDRTINETLVKWLINLNFPGVKGVKIKHTYPDTERLEQLASTMAILNQIGYNVDPDWIETTFGIPQAPKRRSLGDSVLGLE